MEIRNTITVNLNGRLQEVPVLESTEGVTQEQFVEEKDRVVEALEQELLERGLMEHGQQLKENAEGVYEIKGNYGTAGAEDSENGEDVIYVVVNGRTIPIEVDGDVFLTLEQAEAQLRSQGLIEETEKLKYDNGVYRPKSEYGVAGI